MIEYVLGFAFDHHDRVALIRKERPEWQAGRWNGIGGKIEAHENMANAMSREFCEEAGLYLTDWSYAGLMSGKDWVVRVFTLEDPLVQFVETQTDETVRLYARWDLMADAIENVPALVELCRVPRAKRPFFELRY